jgi:hypothetical protein
MLFRYYLSAVILVAIELAIPLACLFVAWFNLFIAAKPRTRRERLPTMAFRLALVSFALAFAYLVRLYILNTPSVLNPPEKFWALVNCLGGLCWLAVLLLVVLGKGKSRVALGLWCVIFPIFVGMAYVAAYAY